jgi:hypothetical protein
LASGIVRPLKLFDVDDLGESARLEIRYGKKIWHATWKARPISNETTSAVVFEQWCSGVPVQQGLGAGLHRVAVAKASMFGRHFAAPKKFTWFGPWHFLTWTAGATACGPALDLRAADGRMDEPNERIVVTRRY